MTDTPASPLNLPHDVMLRARHIVSHLLLPDGASVLDLDCETGALTAAMAQLNPRLNFIGIDRNRQAIMRARARFRLLPNVSFETGDPMGLRKPDDSIDAIIAAGVMGEIYTRSDYDDAPLQGVLQKYVSLLKPDGTLVIHDYAMPPEGEDVQIEFPVPLHDPRHFRLFGKPLEQTQGEREIALLQWFSQNARARDAIKGFYLEEIPAHVPGTRLFRLPAKWAYEFIIRKSTARNFKAHVGHQFTCLSESDYDRLLGRAIGARVVYAAPWRNMHTIRAHYEGSFRLYTADGKLRGYFPAGHVVVAQKTAPGRALKIQELRPSADAPQSLAVQAVRDDSSGEIADVVSREMPETDIIPYFMTPSGRIKVVLRADADKGLANLMPRLRRNLDGKRWSGHMIAAPALTARDLEGFDHASHAAIARLVAQKLGLHMQHGKGFEPGPKGYPSPALIDERLETIFINIQPPELSKMRVAGVADALRLKIYDAQDVLRATGSGFIPSAWLDIQMQALLKKCGHAITPWLHEAVPLAYDPPPEDQMLRAGKILKQKPKKAEKPAGPLYTCGKGGTKWPLVSGAFRPIRGRAGQIGTLRSSFVEQGRVDGVLRGLSAYDRDFAAPRDEMMNIAAVLPLTEDLQGNTLAGFELKELPVPSRFGQTEPMMTLPTLPLPPDIADLDAARAYVAAQFDVEPARVAPMGESFFTFIDMMPQRVFPFMLTRYPRRRNLRMRYMATRDLIDLIDPDFADSILWKWGFANALLCQASAQVQGYDHNVRQPLYRQKTPKWQSASATAKWKDADRTATAKRARPPGRHHRVS